jgi:hypothetical protein
MALDGVNDVILDGGAGSDAAQKDAGDPVTSVEVFF